MKKWSYHSAGLLKDASEDSVDGNLVQRRRASTARALDYLTLAVGVMERQTGAALQFGERGNQSGAPAQERHEFVIDPVDLSPPFSDTHISAPLCDVVFEAATR